MKIQNISCIQDDFLWSIEGEEVLDPRDLASGGGLLLSEFETFFDVSDMTERNTFLRDQEKKINPVFSLTCFSLL